MLENKGNLRKQLLKERQLISDHIHQEKSRQICQNLASFFLLQKATVICSYFSFRKEVNLDTLTENNPQKKWVFPRCENQDLIWHLWTPNDELTKGIYGIKEPLSNSPIITPKNIDLILIPAVACDHRGYRLGYGAGYYDRMFSQKLWQNIPTIGIIFESFYFPQLPADSWDQKLDFICTENQIYTITKDKG